MRAFHREDALVAANPDFADTGTATAPGGTASLSPASARRSAAFAGLAFGPLPGTAGEAAALQKLVPSARMLTGGAATETALKQVKAPRILHIATHGFFLPDEPSRRCRPRGNIGLEVGAALRPAGPLPENPLLRSGLALAGANRLRSGNEDGILTALEASGLDLTGTKLVVLSACETGVGAV